MAMPSATVAAPTLGKRSRRVSAALLTLLPLASVAGDAASTPNDTTEWKGRSARDSGRREHRGEAVLDSPPRCIYTSCMRFRWDERKRKSNLRDHGFDFRDSPSIFEGPTFTFEDDRFDYSEQRFVTLGFLGQVVSQWYTPRHRK